MGHYLNLFLKGVAMGAANVIPGVSGGTIAFITGIYQEFIDALKSFDLSAIRLLAKLRLADFARHVNLPSLVPLFLGVGISLISLGKVLGWLFRAYPVFVWSFFFGLILASVYYVAKKIGAWKPSTVGVFVLGAALALAMAFARPAAENAAFYYVALCGVVAVCSMILPGLSGSFVLILMGNYQLVILQAVPSLDLRIILPFAVGGAIGFVALSRVVSFFMRRFHDGTLSLLTGFILGSLVIIWPWKSERYLADPQGQPILKNGAQIVSGYEWSLPDFAQPATAFAILFMILGYAAVALMERAASASAKR